MEATEFSPVATGTGAGLTHQLEPSRKLTGELDTRAQLQEQRIFHIDEAKFEQSVHLATRRIYRLFNTRYPRIAGAKGLAQTDQLVFIPR